MADIQKGYTFANGEIVTPAKLHTLVDDATVADSSITTAKLANSIVTTAKIADANVTTAKIADAAVTSAKIADGTIVDADISATAAIADTKLAQITTVGKVLPAAVQGTAVITTDSRLSDARTPVSHTHDDRYYTETEIDNKLAGLPVSSHTHAASAITSGTLDIARIPTGTGSTQVALGNHTHSAATTSAAGFLSAADKTKLDAATNANTANAIVARDGSGNFNAGTITAALSGNAATATTAASCSGNAATATTLQTARTINGVSFNGSANITVTADPNAHTHTIANVTGLQSALDGKQAAGSYAPATGIAPSAITGTAVITTDARLSDNRTPVDASVTTAKLATATQQLLVPTGAIMAFAMNSAPSGWLPADGAAQSRSTYAALFSVIGTTYGDGNGSTTFNLPDLRGLFVRGSGSQTFGGSTYSGTFASKSHDTFESHNHAFNGNLSVNPVVAISAPEAGNTATSGSAGRVTSVSATTSSASVSGSTNPSGAGETAPANIALLYCIKF